MLQVNKDMVRTTADEQTSRTFQGSFKDKLLQFFRAKIYSVN